MRSVCRIVARLAAICYPFIVFALLRFATLDVRRLCCGVVLCGILLFCGGKILKNRKSLRAGSFVAPAVAGALLAAILLSGNEQFFKLYPIFVSVAMLFIFARSLVSPPCIVEQIARATDSDFSDAAIPYARRVTQVWCGFFVFNIVASAASALISWEAWCLYNGVLSYCLMGILFAAEFVVRKAKKRSLPAFVKPSQLLAHGGGVFGNKAAFAGNGGEISFAQFQRATAKLTTILRAKPQPDCALCCDDTFLFAAGFFAALLAGKRVLLPQSLAAGMGEVVKKFSPVFLSDKASGGDVVALTHGVGGGDWVGGENWVGGGDGVGGENWVGGGNNADFPAIDRAARLLFFTSGSTGEPKLIEKTFANIEDEIVRLNAFLPAFARHQPATTIATVKCNHLYGLLYACILPLCRGATIAATTVSLPTELGSVVGRGKNLCLVSSPAFLSRWSQDEELTKNFARAGGQSLILSSASPLPRDVALKIFRATTIPPLEVYGTTETGGIAYRRQSDGEDWTCWDGVKISLGGGQNRELVVQTPLANDNAPTPTGDAAELTGAGTFRLLGRVDRLAKIRDCRVSLSEVEALLSQSPLVKEAFAMVVGDGGGGQQSLGALVALSQAGRKFATTNGVPALSAELKNFLKSRAEPSAVPKKWRYATELPRNQQSKIVAGEVLEKFATKLQEPLVEMVVAGADCVEADLIFLKNSAYFRGHFPTFSLLPGVVQLHFVALYARRFLHVCVSDSSISKLKFKFPIFPGDRVRLSMKKTPSRLEFSLFAHDRICASGRFDDLKPA